MPPRRGLCLMGVLVAAVVSWWMQLRAARDLPYAMLGVVLAPVMLWFLLPGGDDGR